MPPYEPGRYVCIGTHGLDATIVKIATRSPFSHVAMLTSIGGDLIQAMPGGMEYGHITDYAGCRMAANLAEPMSPVQQAQLVEAAEAMIGVRYNDLAIVDDGLRALGLVWGWLGNLANTDGAFDCSQALALMGKAAGYDWSCGKKRLCEVTPGDLGRRKWMVPITVPEPGARH